MTRSPVLLNFFHRNAALEAAILELAEQPISVFRSVVFSPLKNDAPIPGRAKRPDTMICVYFLLLSRGGAMIASRENSFPSEPFSRGDHCLPRVVELETPSSAGISVRIAELRRMAFLLALSPAPWSTRRGRRGAHCIGSVCGRIV